MNIRLEQLESQLQQGLKPVYIVSGDEPLQAQEACQLIRQAAHTAGYTERETYNADSSFNWDELLSAGSSLSLFSAQKVLELRLPTGKPGTEGSKALLSYADIPTDNLLLINAGKLDKSAKNSKWYKTLDKIGCHIEVWPIESRQLPKWIEQRMRRAGLIPDREAAQLLAELVDGNLLAASQEIEKLTLLLPENQPQVSQQTIRSCVVDSARYSAFDLIDTALRGDHKSCLKMLRGLQDEGIEPLSLIWILAREIRQLSLIKQDIQQGVSTEQAMQSQRVWRNRQPLIKSALSKLSLEQLALLNQSTAHADQLAKGMHQGNIWDELEQICLGLAALPLRQADQ